MGNAVPMTVKVYPICSFQTPNVLLPYILSDALRVVSMSTPPIQQGIKIYMLLQNLGVLRTSCSNF